MTTQPWFPEDLRQRAAGAVRDRLDTLAADLDVLIAAGLPEPPAGDLRARLVTRLLDLLAVAISAGAVVESPLLLEVARLEEAGAKLQDLFAAVRLAERSILQELSVDAQLGAITEHWPAVTELVRKASFDLLSAVCARRAMDASQGVVDPVTTLMSRAVFEMAITKELQRAIRYHHALALILFDVDNLAAINDTQGYGVGDLVLERLGVFMRQYFRQPDWVGRYGGDSIAVLLPETTASDALTLAEGARQAVEERLVFPDKEEHPIGITVSGAVVTITLRGESGEGGESLETVRVMTDAEAGVKRAQARGGNTIERVEVGRDSLSVGEAAAYLHCSLGAIRKLIAAGTLPAVEAGGRTRIDRTALEAYGCRHPTPVRKRAE
jgi:diguanylate cyclase (GGDEF)-like protein/excisionase family DNA binding protein